MRRLRVLFVSWLCIGGFGCDDSGRPGDPAALAFSIDQDAIDHGAFSPELLFNVGVELFLHVFSCAEGGGEIVGGRCVHDRQHGPESQACIECHNLPLRDGGGSLATNIFRGGTTLSSGTERNSPHLFGAGYVEALGREMTRALHDEAQAALDAARATGVDQTITLLTKGVSFGSLTAHPDNTYDLSEPGISHDLVLRPFMSKGLVRTIREQNLGAFFGHLGIQPSEVVGKDVDGDGDGVVDELSPGRLSAMVAYEAMLASPTFIATTPQAKEGAPVFIAIGCASCHRPILELEDPHLRIENPANPAHGFVLDLTRHVEAPRLVRVSDGGPVRVPLFSDLKRHDLGPDLADPIESDLDGNRDTTDDRIAASLFVTSRLWGVGSTAPYLHDGRAATIEDAIALHGGEALAARNAFMALGAVSRQRLLDFLSSLVLQRSGGTARVPEGLDQGAY